MKKNLIATFIMLFLFTMMPCITLSVIPITVLLISISVWIFKIVNPDNITDQFILRTESLCCALKIFTYFLYAFFLKENSLNVVGYLGKLFLNGNGIPGIICFFSLAVLYCILTYFICKSIVNRTLLYFICDFENQGDKLGILSKCNSTRRKQYEWNRAIMINNETRDLIKTAKILFHANFADIVIIVMMIFTIFQLNSTVHFKSNLYIPLGLGIIYLLSGFFSLLTLKRMYVYDIQVCYDNYIVTSGDVFEIN